MSRQPRNLSIGMMTANPVPPATFASRQKMPIGATFMTALMISKMTPLTAVRKSVTMVV